MSSGHNHSNMKMESSMEQMGGGNSQNQLQHEMFKVSGNCGMCKETIETAVKSMEGIKEAEWNQETKMIHVSFDANKLKLMDIHKAIAKVGYDTELEKADDEVYKNLPECCQYTRDNTPTHAENIQHEMFKVSGNCGMCKETIETAVKALQGIKEADWNQETKMIHVSFDANKLKLPDIHKAIAKVGYDTELEKADDEVYKNLPECCQYER